MASHLRHCLPQVPRPWKPVTLLLLEATMTLQPMFWLISVSEISLSAVAGRVPKQWPPPGRWCAGGGEVHDGTHFTLYLLPIHKNGIAGVGDFGIKGKYKETQWQETHHTKTWKTVEVNKPWWLWFIRQQKSRMGTKSKHKYSLGTKTW